jgi:hypothetical protein
MMVNLNGYLGKLPEDRCELIVPKTWLPVFVCPITYEGMAKTVRPPKGFKFDWSHMPDWAITDSYQFDALFLFKDQFDALTFELRYL